MSYKYTLKRQRMGKTIGKYKLKTETEFKLGRSEEKADICIKDDSVSRKHARLSVALNGEVSI